MGRLRRPSGSVSLSSLGVSIDEDERSGGGNVVVYKAAGVGNPLARVRKARPTATPRTVQHTFAPDPMFERERVPHPCRPHNEESGAGIRSQRLISNCRFCCAAIYVR